MNDIKHISYILTCILILGGCATTPVPDAVTLRHIPVVEYGQRPVTADYIMHFRKGADIPVMLSIKGKMIDNQERMIHVRVNREMFIYKHWLSYDNKQWQHGYMRVDPKLSADFPNPDRLLTYTIFVKMPEKVVD